ncbi:hypothetical protein EC912_10344 [Luteibacter rhizovicinus]|uniref:Uncharacterized protein n=1 Tax=Luteibacter rhizovicinus TaxID=242606 RepID=A0A4R3YQ93_9GAMM|nr:hypothetical protein [Luteibacter rhizovicinus]TCV94561.1 hypothetical protein EC912_10344 [Luteibacter rhizovicinus]
MKIAALAFGGLTAFVSMQSTATDDYNRTINAVGVQSTSAYVQFKEGFSGSCAFSSIYPGSLETQATKAMLATLLSARSPGGKVSHIAYTTGSDGFCTANQVEVQ